MIDINDKRIVVYDFETDGFFSTQGYTRPIELAVLDIDLVGKDYNFYRTLIKRRKDAKPLNKIVTNFWDIKKDPTIEPITISDITGITDEMIMKDGDDIENVFRKLSIILEKPDDILVVGHNILKFDNLFVNQRFTKYGYPLLSDTICFDTAGEFKGSKLNTTRQTHELICDYHRRVLNKPVKGLRYAMGVVLEDYGIEETVARHRADIDITYNLKVFVEQLKRSIDVIVSQENIEYLDNLYTDIMNKWQEK